MAEICHEKKRGRKKVQQWPIRSVSAMVFDSPDWERSKIRLQFVLEDENGVVKDENGEEIPKNDTQTPAAEEYISWQTMIPHTTNPWSDETIEAICRFALDNHGFDWYKRL